MKDEGPARAGYCKFALLLVLYTLVLLLIPRSWTAAATGTRAPGTARACSAAWECGAWRQRRPKRREQGAERGQPRRGRWRVPQVSGNLNSAVGEAASREKQHIYVHATWRTGSSFLGELFNQHPDVFCLYEPMWHLWQALYPGDAEACRSAPRHAALALHHDFSVLQLYAPPGDPAAPPRRGQSPPRPPSFAGGPTRSSARRRCALVDPGPLPRSASSRTLPAAQLPTRGTPSPGGPSATNPVVVIKGVRLLDLGVLVPLPATQASTWKGGAAFP